MGTRENVTKAPDYTLQKLEWSSGVLEAYGPKKCNRERGWGGKKADGTNRKGREGRTWEQDETRRNYNPKST